VTVCVLVIDVCGYVCKCVCVCVYDSVFVVLSVCVRVSN